MDTISARKREISTKGQLRSLRNQGRVPAVIYGLGQDPAHIDLPFPDLRVMLAQGDRTRPVTITMDDQSHTVIIKDLDREPIKRDVRHVDFLRVSDDHPVILKIPVHPEGIAFGVKTEGGVFSVMKKWVKLKGLIKAIPNEIKIDISEMKAGEVFYAKDLPLPENVRLVTPPKTALFGISKVRGGA